MMEISNDENWETYGLNIFKTLNGKQIIFMRFF